ncbi:MAG: S8 family serine peptidase, partial [Bacteroidota bacterium]
TEADYYLARTDQGDREYRGEEDYWVAALEWMYDKGVRLVNSSVGYSNGYDDPSEDYERAQVDGESSAITKVAAIAAKEKGMILVIAAGNDGNKDFEIISVPADAEGVISVGASGFRQWNKAGYSAIGAEHMDDIKPEVACYSFSGTSFSAPVITGLVACIWQAYPDLTNKEVIDYIKESSHLYNAPNNYLGYGVPNAKRILKLIKDQKTKAKFDQLITLEETVSIEFLGETNIIAFHKKDDRIVIKQQSIDSKRGVAVIKKFEGAKRTTVATPDRVVEIYWKD